MGQSYYRRCAHLTWQYNLYCQILLITQGPQVCKDDTVLKCRPLVSLGHAIPDIAQTHREGTVAQLPKMPLHFKLRMAIPSTRVGTSILPFNLGPFRQPQLHERDFPSLPLRARPPLPPLRGEDSLITRVVCPVHLESHQFSANGP